MDVSPDVTDAHYDAASKEGKMNRRREYMGELENNLRETFLFLNRVL
jgi:hypothetical protein